MRHARAGLIALALLAAAGPARATDAPIAATGWTRDFVLGPNELHATHEHPVNGNIWFAENSTVTPGDDTDGLPASGAVTIGGTNFQFESFTNYAANSVVGAGTLTLVAPTNFMAINVLGAPASGVPAMTLHFSGGVSSVPVQLSFAGWGGAGDISPGLTPDGLTRHYSGGISVFRHLLLATEQTNSLLSVSFSGGGPVFALSGEPYIADVASPTPDPMTFSVAPETFNATTIVMTATTATDLQSHPVQYLFTNTTSGTTSGWVLGTVWTNTGLATGVTNGYMVKARDGVQNETGWATEAFAAPEAETDPPTPNPMTFSRDPVGGDGTTMDLVATAASDNTPPVYYEFENTTNGHFHSWSTRTTWTDTGLTPGSHYGYRVRARDSSVPANTGAWSIVSVLQPQVLVSSYAYEVGAPGGWPDTVGTELTDGWLQTSGGYDQPGNVGFRNTSPQIVFDLGAEWDVATIDVTYWANANWRPTNAVVSVSSDGTTYSATVGYPLTNNVLTTVTLDMSAFPDARFYRIFFQRSGEWMWFSEVDFYPPAPIPPAGSVFVVR